MSSRDISDLIPEAQKAYTEAKEECRKAGIVVVETCVKRTTLEHEALFAQGRLSYYAICKMRELAGLWPIDEDVAKKEVTWTFLSKHRPEMCFRKDHEYYGKVLAVDFALSHLVNNKPKLHWNIKVDVNNNEMPDYEEAATIFVKHGFESGAFWKKKDYPHIQYPHKEAL